MLKEVGQAVLIVVFLQCSDVVYNVKIRTTLVFGVVAEVLGEAVFELSYGRIRVVRYLLTGRHS